VVGVHELVDQARLPHARLAHERYDLAVSRPSLLQGLLQGQQLLLPAHKAGEPACRAGLQTPTDGTRSNQLKDFNRLCQSLDRKPPQGVDLHQPFGKSEGGSGQPDTTWGGQLLHARRQVGGLADGGIVHMQVIANGPYDDFARVEAHPHLHLQTVGLADLLRVTTHGCLHRQGGITGPHRMVFVGHWCPKERHDPVAQHLIDGALVAVHGVHHDVQGGVQNGLGLFRVEVADQLCRALEVGKQHGHLLAFAFQGTFGRQDLLSKIWRGVGERCAVLGAGWGNSWEEDRCLTTCPDQDAAVLIHRQTLALNEFGCQIFQIRVIELELPLEGAIG
jgi:hypothetical protein